MTNTIATNMASGAPLSSTAANNGGASPVCEASGTGSGAGTPHRDAGPPTPTHSENTDPHAPPLHLDTALPRKSKHLMFVITMQ